MTPAGVVGPVRTGKSTFIKRFMDLIVIPNIDNQYSRERARDELPQSASGRTIMTTEPKFVPNEAVDISLEGGAQFSVRMVDCVGYLVNGALGYLEDDVPRMVSTPWYENPIPFEEASEIGTRKVITEHSTIGLVITTDGSITDIPREDYIEAEERVVNELKEIDKPFIVVLNSLMPYDYHVQKLREDMENRYEVPVIALNCATIGTEEIHSIMKQILYEFPVSEVDFQWPKWLGALDYKHWLKQEIVENVTKSTSDIRRLKDIEFIPVAFNDCQWINKVWMENIRPGDGGATFQISLVEGLFYDVLTELTGIEIKGEEQLVSLMKDFSRIKNEFEKIEFALHQVKSTGYGIVTPMMDEMKLEEPEIVKHGNRFGVKLRASAPSIHIECNKRKLQNHKGRSNKRAGISDGIQFRGIPSNLTIANFLRKTFFGEKVSGKLFTRLGYLN